MMISSFARVLPFVALTLLSQAAFAVPIQVVGRVLDGTTKGGAPGAVVQLVRPALKNENSKKLLEKKLSETRADSQGRFSFPPMNVPDNDLILARVNWQGYAYYNTAYVNTQHAKKFGLSADPKNVQVQVFDGTDSPVPLTATVHHVAIKSNGGALKCIERYVFNNPTRKTYTGSGPEKITIRLALPPGVQDLKIDPAIRNAKLVKTGDGYGVSMPIPPSTYYENKLIINYSLPWPIALPWTHGIDLSRKMIYPTNFFFVAREEGDRKLQITAPKLGSDENAQIPVDNKAETRIVNPLGRPMGDAPALLAGTPVEIHVARPVNPLFYGFVAFVGALALMVPVALAGGARRKRQPTSTFKSAEPALAASVYRGTPAQGISARMIQDDSDTHDPSVLIERIAQLDDEFEAGGLDSDAYHSQRAAWKKALVAALAQRPS